MSDQGRPKAAHDNQHLYHDHNHYHHHHYNLLPRLLQVREDPQKKGNIESGEKEKLDLIFSIGRSPGQCEQDDLYYSNFLLEVVMDMVPIVVANKSITFIMINRILFMMIATKSADNEGEYLRRGIHNYLSAAKSRQ